MASTDLAFLGCAIVIGKVLNCFVGALVEFGIDEVWDKWGEWEVDCPEGYQVAR
ncbi:hypothetical protein PENSPDRAFT_651863 [Peniophora sp. CONT]|nr:hypothetical protein PENSPDRAFT_651863 [Peniophora sp. CONT]